MLKKINIGFVGAGFISQICHLPSFQDKKNANYIAICDHDMSLAMKVAKKYNIKKVYKNHIDMIKNEKSINTVVLSVPRHNTFDVAKYILNSKKNLFSEKPMSQSFKSAKYLVNLAKKNNVKYVIGYMKRFDECSRYLKQKIINKNLNINLLKSIYYKSFAGDSFGDFRKYIKRKKEYNPHAISVEARKNQVKKKNKTQFLKFLNTHSHAVNLIRYFIGDINLNDKNLDKNGEGLIFFRKKKINIILSTRYLYSNDWYEEIELIFKDHKVLISLPMPMLINQPGKIKITNLKTSEEKKILLKWKWSFSNQAQNFIDLLKKNKKNPCEAKYCLDDIRLIENIFA